MDSFRTRRTAGLFQENGLTFVQHITEYEYGKVYHPVVSANKRHYLEIFKKKCLLDRADLISKIHQLLVDHRLNRECRNQCPSRLHKAMKVAIRSCYENNIGESCLYPVGELFHELNLCEGSSKALFSVVLHKAPLDRVLYLSAEQTDIQSAFSYYLKHVCAIRTVGLKTQIDLLNTEVDAVHCVLPLQAAIQKKDPSLVLCLLKYGADPLQVTKVHFDNDVMQYTSPAKQIIDDLNSLFALKNSGFILNPHTRKQLAKTEEKAWTILRYIRRTVSVIPLTSSTHIVTCSEGEDNDTEEEKCEIPLYSVHPKIADIIDMDFFKLASLQQSCRCAIRGQLKNNFSKVSNVPKGIELLPLPQVLKSYLNLESD